MAAIDFAKGLPAMRYFAAMGRQPAIYFVVAMGPAIYFAVAMDPATNFVVAMDLAKGLPGFYFTNIQ